MYGKGGWAEQDCLSDSEMPQLRPGKLDLLFHISHLLDLHAGRWLYSLFITICYIHSENLRRYSHYKWVCHCYPNLHLSEPPK